MRKIALISSLLFALSAAPAAAEEGEEGGGVHAELRGGVVWSEEETEPLAGVAVAYDFDLSEDIFVGAEVSGEKALAEDTHVELALTGRFGTAVSEAGSLFANGGYTFTHHGDGPHLGFGYEHHLGHGGTYLSAEFRHVFVEDHETNAITIGIGTFF